MEQESGVFRRQGFSFLCKQTFTTNRFERGTVMQLLDFRSFLSLWFGLVMCGIELWHSLGGFVVWSCVCVAYLVVNVCVRTVYGQCLEAFLDKCFGSFLFFGEDNFRSKQISTYVSVLSLLFADVVVGNKTHF